MTSNLRTFVVKSDYGEMTYRVHPRYSLQDIKTYHLAVFKDGYDGRPGVPWPDYPDFEVAQEGDTLTVRHV